MMPAGMMMFRDPAIKVFIPQKNFFLGPLPVRGSFCNNFFFFFQLFLDVPPSSWGLLLRSVSRSF